MSEHPNECQTDCPIQLPTEYSVVTLVPKLWYGCNNSLGTGVTTALEQVCQKSDVINYEQSLLYR